MKTFGLLPLIHIAGIARAQFSSSYLSNGCVGTVFVTVFPPDYTGSYTTVTVTPTSLGGNASDTDSLSSLSTSLPSGSPSITSVSLSIPSTSISTPSTSLSTSSGYSSSQPGSSTATASTSSSLSSQSISLSSGSLSIPSTSISITSVSLSSGSLSVPSTSISISSVSPSSGSLSIPSTSISLSSISLSSGSLSLSVSSISLSSGFSLSTIAINGASASSTLSGSSTSTRTSLPTATRPAVVACPRDDGVNFVTTSGKAYQIHCATNEVGYDITNNLRPDLQSCIGSCGYVSGCAGVSYVQSTATCYYKGYVGQGTPDSGFDSAVPVNLTCPDADGTTYVDNLGNQYEVLCNTYFPASTNMTSTPAMSFTDCSNTCSNTTSCTGVSYANGSCTQISDLGSNTGTPEMGTDTVVLLARRAVYINPQGSTVVSTSTPATIPSYSISRSLAPIYSTPTIPGFSITYTPPTVSMTGVSLSSGSISMPSLSLSGSSLSMSLSVPGMSVPSVSVPSITIPGMSLSSSSWISIPSVSVPSITTPGMSLSGSSLSSIPSISVPSVTIPGMSMSGSSFSSIPGASIPSVSIPGYSLSSSSLSGLPPITGTSSGPNPAATTSQNLACNDTQQSYTYNDPTSGSQYIVECNTTHAGGVYNTLQTPDMASCIAACSADPQCEAAGYDSSSGTCYEFNSEVPGSGMYSPNMQFAQLSKRAVVVGGTTYTYPITTSYYPSSPIGGVSATVPGAYSGSTPGGTAGMSFGVGSMSASLPGMSGSLSITAPSISVPTSLGSLSISPSLPGVSMSMPSGSVSVPSVTVPGISVPSASGSYGSPTTSFSPLPTATNLSCDGSRSSYDYVDQATGSVYTVQCNTTVSGGIYNTEAQPDMASCLSSCAADTQCEAAAYDTSSGQCYKYSNQVQNSGSYSTNLNFAQLKVRAVVANGVTQSYPVTTIFASSGIQVVSGATYTYNPAASQSGYGVPSMTASVSLPGMGGLSSLVPTSSVNLAGMTSILPSLTFGGPVTTAFPSISTVSSLGSATAPTSALSTQTAVAYSCPANNGQVINENGLMYVVGCNLALSGGYYAVRAASNSWSDCFALCDQSSTNQGAQYCTGFTFVGAANGAGPGSCYLYNNVGEGYVVGNSSTVAAVRLSNYVSDPNALPGAGVSVSLGVGVGVSVSNVPTTSISVSISLPTDALNSLSNIAGTTNSNSAPSPTLTCSNGGDPLNACVVVGVSATPGVGVSGGVAVGGSSSTLLNVDASATLGVSASVAASLGVGVSVGSSGIGLGVSGTVGVGAGATASAGASVGGGAASGVDTLLSTVGGGLGGVLGGGSGVTSSISLQTTTVQSTTTITSCSYAMNGQLTCPAGASNTLVASVSTTLSSNTATVYIAFTTTVTASISSSSSAPASSCTTLLGGVVSCLPLNLGSGGLTPASTTATTTTTQTTTTSTTTTSTTSSSSRSTSSSFSTSSSRSSTITASASYTGVVSATANCGQVVNGLLQACPTSCALLNLGGLACV